jgi:hypothetical protein
MKSPEVVITPLPYTTRIDRRGDFRMSSHTALVTDATAALYRKTHGATIFIPGESTFGPDYPSTASLMKAQLVKKGVPEAVITTQDDLNDTESQLRAIQERGIQNPTIVDMKFHDGRVNVLRRQLKLEGQTIQAEKLILETHKGATPERLKKFAATKSKLFGVSVPLTFEVGIRFLTRFGTQGKKFAYMARKAVGADGATVTDFNVAEPAKKHFNKAMQDPAKREQILAQKKKAA